MGDPELPEKNDWRHNDRRHSQPFLIRYASLINTVLLTLIALMGLWLRGEFLNFAKRELQPLADELRKESFERQLSVERLRATTERLDDTLKNLQKSMEETRVKLERIYDETVPGRK